MKIKVTKDECWFYAIIPDELEYDDQEIDVSRKEAERILLAFNEFQTAQDRIKELLEGIAG